MGKLHMSRRDFVKVSVVTGAAFGISALAEPSLAVADDAVAAAAKWNAALSP